MKNERAGGEMRTGTTASVRSLLENILKDVRVGARAMRSSPGVTAIAVVTLALGIGATTTAYTVINALLLRPLPYPESENLTYVYQADGGEEGKGTVSIRNFFDLKENVSSFETLAATGGWYDPTYLGDGGPTKVDGAFGSADLFRVLRVSPMLGRTFDATDTDEVVVISHAFWQQYLGARQDVIGRTLLLDGEARTVIGVMPQSFRGPMHLDADLWAHFPTRAIGQRRSRNMTVLGRLAETATMGSAAQEVETVAAGLREEFPDDLESATFGLRPLREEMFGDSRQPLGILLGSAALLLLIGCVNLSSVFLARGISRQREISVRLALGAGRGRIVRQLLVEAGLLVLLGGGVGVALATGATDAVAALGPAILQSRDVGMDMGVLLFASTVMILTIPLVALLPALRASRADLRGSLGDRGGKMGNRGDVFLRNALVVVQLGLSVMMLTAGGAFGKQLVELNSTEPGFRSADLVATEVSLSQGDFPEEADLLAFFEELLPRIEAIPGAERVAVGSLVPFTGQFFTTGVRLEGREYAPDDYGEMVDRSVVSPSYFSSLGIPVVQGRSFDPGDRAGAAGVAVLNQELAERLFGEDDPIGRRIRLSFADSARTVVGVVGNVKMESLEEETHGQVYLPLGQEPVRDVTLVVGSQGDASTLVPVIRETVTEIQPNQAIGDVATLDELVAETRRPIRFMTLLLSALAVVALVIASAGLYGVSAYFAQRRKTEFGIRMALGADGGDIMRLMFWRSLGVTIVGLVLGIAGTVAVSKVMVATLPDMPRPDSTVLVGVAALLAVVSMVAAGVPAFAAGRRSPSMAMDSDPA